MDRAAGSDHATANCGSCGRAWFGEVAYCPYCGRPSAPEAGTPRIDAANTVAPLPRQDSGSATSAPAAVEPPEMHWKAWWKPAVGVVAAATLVAVMLGQRAVTPAKKASPQDARAVPAVVAPPAVQSATMAVNANPAPNGAAPANTAQATPAEPEAARSAVVPPQEPGPPARPAPARSLCSPANEVAGLCNPR